MSHTLSNYYNFPKSFCMPPSTWRDSLNLKECCCLLVLVGDYLLRSQTIRATAEGIPWRSASSATAECLDKAIEQVKPGLFVHRDLGTVIEEHANKNNCSVLELVVMESTSSSLPAQ